MKITGYQPTIQLNVGNTPKVQAAGDLNSFGGRGQGLGEISQGLQQMAAAAQRQQEDEDATTASAAQLAYTQKMNDALYGEKGLLLTQQGGAKGVTQNLVDTERKIRDEVTKNYKFNTKKGVAVFDGLANRIASDRYELVRKHEYVEGEKEKDTVLNTSLYTNGEFAAKNYKDDALIGNTLQTDDALIATRYKDFGADVIKAKQIEHRADVLSKGLNAALTAEDYNRAEVLSYKYRDFIPANKLAEATKFVTANRKKNNEIINNKSRYGKFGDDLNGALADIETNNTGDATATRKAIVQNMKHKIGTKYEIGGNGIDSTDCGKSVLDSWQEAGIQFSSRYVPYMIEEAKEKGIWHEAGTYTPQPGDLVVVDGDNHVVMYGDNGGTIQAGVSRGKVYESNDSPEKMFGEVTGYISVPVEGKSAAQIEEEKKSYISYYNQQKSVKNAVDNQSYADVSDSMLAAYKNGERDPNVFLNMAKQAAGSDYSKLVKYTEAAERIGKLSEGPTRSKSDTNTMLYMNRIISNATIDDIPTIRATLYNNASNLTQSDLISFDSKLNGIANGKDDKEGKAADDAWQAEVSNKEIKANILAILQNRGVHGWERYEVASQIIKDKTVNGRNIKNYSESNNDERQSIIDAWGDSGEKLVSLAEKGFKQGYMGSDGTPYKWDKDYHAINVFISDIGSQMQNDSAAEDALDYILSRNLPLNPETFNAVYAQIKGE